MSRLPLFFTVILLASLLFGMGASSYSPAPASPAEAFSFVSIGDAQGAAERFSTSLEQAASLDPDFMLFTGDLEYDGVLASEMNTMTDVFKNAGVFNQTFLVRGNHDDHQPGSAALWEQYFTTTNRPLPAGLSHYVALDAGSTYLSYSFDYGNSRFIAVDAPGQSEMITPAQYAFMDQRLADAEASGLVHAFIIFHGPAYCVEANHCECARRDDSSCTQAEFIDLVNRHPILSATIHGHEHILGWTHMDGSRISNLTQSYEQLLTSPSGGVSSNDTLYPARVDYAYPDMADYATGFAMLTVNGRSFTFSLYKTGLAAPVWSRTFINPPALPQSTVYLPLIGR
jgi:3',5'-cyclic AMP phosphodiesterase CpdA